MEAIHKSKWVLEFIAAAGGVYALVKMFTNNGRRTLLSGLAPAAFFGAFLGLYYIAPATNAGTTAPQANTARDYQSAKQSLAEERYEEATEKAKLYVQEAPGDKEGHRLLGTCYSALHKWEGTAMEYEEIIKTDAHDMDAYMGLAVALEALHDKTGAINAYRTVTKTLTSAPSQRLLAGKRLKALGQ